EQLLPSSSPDQLHVRLRRLDFTTRGLSHHECCSSLLGSDPGLPPVTTHPDGRSSRIDRQFVVRAPSHSNRIRCLGCGTERCTPWSLHYFNDVHLHSGDRESPHEETVVRGL